MKPESWKNKVQEYIQEHKLRRRWLKITASLGAFAVVVTAAAMILPAITMENAPQMLECQIGVHTHKDSCYDAEGNIVCGFADFVVHTHNDSCYAEDGTLICPLDEIEAHTHDASCYQETRVSVCGLEERAGHIHDASCYQTAEEPACGLEESVAHVHEGHIHTEACYEVSEILICSQSEAGHTHTVECYETRRTLICTQDTGCYDAEGNLACEKTTEGHTHTVECYPEELICGKEETTAHAHTDDCYEIQEELVCGKEEIILHTHIDACFDENGNLPCGMPEVKEHVHDETCLPETEDSSTEESEAPSSQSGTSWATVERTNSTSAFMNRLFSTNPGINTLAEESFDFTNNIDTISVSKGINGEWTESTEFADGDAIQVTITYSFNADVLNSNTIWYQLPNGIALQEIETGRVTSGEDEVGDYTIGTNGLIIITFDEGFNTSEAFAGSIMFQGYVSYAAAGDGGQIDFGGSGTTITVTPGEETYDLTAAKTATYADGTISYTITVSTKEGTDGSITISDRFQHQTNYAYVTYSENSFVITKSDGTNVTGYTVAVNNNGAGSFRIENLPALQAGESYTITYTAAIDLDQSPGDQYGYLEVSNTVTAQDNTNSASASARVTVFNTLLTKTGSYNEETQEITWTITINTGGRDIGGYELSDVLTLPDDTTVQITSATLNGEEITLPYTFPAGSTGTYTITYTTKVEYPEAGDTLTNTARLGEYSASTGVTIPSDEPGEDGQAVLTKTTSPTGEDGTYADDVTMDVSGDSVIYYKISVSDYGDTTEAVITDTLPDGVTLVEGSIRLVVDNLHTSSYPEDSYYLQSAVLNENTLIFTMVRMNQMSSFDIYYAVSVPGEDGTYTNTANWGDLTDSTTTTVNYTRPVVEKTGTAVEEDGETIVRYSMIINPEGTDLDPENDTLTLTDELTLSSAAAGAVFRPETVVLYVYDPAAENGCGEQITGGYTVDYDADSYTITFTIPDSMACVVVYEYAVNRGNAAGKVEINNTATLIGVAAGAGNDQIIIEDQTSSADVNQAKLRIYKVDAENYTDLLPGAAFEIYRFEQTDDGGYDWIQTILTAQGEDGQYIVGETGYIELNFVEHLTAGSLYNTLYRLNEITAPTGYTASDETYYFVWMEQSATEESTIAAMTETGAVPESFSFETANVVFIPYSTDSAIYVPNESSTTFISVTKQWQGAEGTPLEEGLPESVEITLYQVSEDGAKTQYEADGVTNPAALNADNNWRYTWEQLPKEDAQGNPVTYTVEETPIAGWEASYDYGDGEEPAGIAEGTIQITNTKQSAYTLPETGGVGPASFIIAGLLLVEMSGVGYLYFRQKRRKGGHAH